MTSYGSYNETRKPIILNSVIISICNCGFSFIAGFAVWAIVGYLEKLGTLKDTKTSSVGLAFIAYPAAIETMPGANFWSLLFTLTLFTLGIDSAFAMVEGTVIVIQDSSLGKKLSKFVIALILCVFGACVSILFCFNWGYALFDCIDHYLNIYTIMLMAVLQAVGAAWYHCQDDAMATCKISSLVLMVGYWVMVIPMPWLQYFAFPDSSWVGLLVCWLWFILTFVVSALVACMGPNKLAFRTWYDQIFLSGVKPISNCMCALSESAWSNWSQRLFELWWGVSIKFVIPWALWTLLVMTVKSDIDEPYGGFHVGWQVLGALVPIMCFIIFLIPLIFSKAQPSGEFKKTFQTKGTNNRVGPTKEAEVAQNVELKQNE